MQGCGTRGWYKGLVPGFGKCPRVWYKGLVQGFGTGFGMSSVQGFGASV